ncbi:LGFP repeat-containing protein, partial [Bacillus toyonensis]|uniref:LGFP repeat-containing protein n=1 Tax=Bacillus toyonensis TaxID=155322 RepID=UPI003D1E2B2A
MPTNLAGFTIFGAIEQKWLATGGQFGSLGLPTSNETPTFDGAGRFQTFKGGTIAWHPQIGAFEVHGLISAKWWELGRERYGYPITEETSTPDGKGRYNHFRA